MNIANNNYYVGVGRRKTATARVWLKEGTGQSQVRTKHKNATAQKVQAEIVKLEKSLRNLNQTSDNQKTVEKTNQGLSKTKFEMEEKLIELKKKLKQEKKKWKELKDYFYMEPGLCEDIYWPLKLFNKEKDYDLIVRVRGSGFHSQAEAIRSGVVQALLKISPEYKTTLKSFKLLTRDARKVERKKIGLKKSRKAPQWSKR